jgi:predicted NodU family carbamoyl transferase
MPAFDASARFPRLYMAHHMTHMVFSFLPSPISLNILLTITTERIFNAVCRIRYSGILLTAFA